MINQASVYTFDAMIASLRRAIEKFPDARKGKNTQYEVMDAGASAFSVFFTQCPSFLYHQKLMQKRYGLSNAKTLFGITDIPSDNQVRNILDPINPSRLDGVFEECFNALLQSRHLDAYRVKLGQKKNDLLLALDGTEYHSSETVHCKNCSTRKRDGRKRYLHGVITPTIVSPGQNRVISLSPEFIAPRDGTVKQDCEQNAAKRWIRKHGKKYSSSNMTILGDDLYCHEPMARTFLASHFNFILVCKPESHKTTYEWICGAAMEKVVDKFDGKTHQIYTYKYMEGVPLRDAPDALLVNFVEVTVTDRKSGKQLYHNAFATNHPLTDKTLPLLVDCGRARWKIENENNNTLKRQGYHLEHNFGHGKQNLSSLLATINILAFLFHTMLEFMNKKYKLLREMLGTRRRLFEHIRVLLIHIPCTNFDHFMTYMIESLKEPYDLETVKFPV